MAPSPSLEQCVDWCEKNQAGYSREEVRLAWQSFEVTKEDGNWLFGKNIVRDWRMALSLRLETQKKNTAPREAPKEYSAEPGSSKFGKVDFRLLRAPMPEEEALKKE